MKIRFIAGGCVVVLLAAADGLAHHSAAGIDRSRTVTIEGTVKQFRWQNPHSFMQIDVPDDRGGTVTWTLEMTAPSFLIRAGWTRSTVKAGDAVTAVVRPLLNGDPGGLFVSVTATDGKTYSERGRLPE
jgi:hypothetical protein